MTSARRRIALFVAPDLRDVAGLVDEALAALDDLDREVDPPPLAVPFLLAYRVDPSVVQARRKLIEARAMLRGG